MFFRVLSVKQGIQFYYLASWKKLFWHFLTKHGEPLTWETLIVGSARRVTLPPHRPLAGWPFFNARVTLIARPTFLHLNNSARPAWVTLVLPPQSRGENHSMRECCCHLLLGGNNFFLILGTRYYLSLGGGGGGLEGGSLDFWENKRGDGWKTLEGFRGGTTQICSENEDMWGGGVGDATII